MISLREGRHVAPNATARIRSSDSRDASEFYPVSWEPETIELISAGHHHLSGYEIALPLMAIFFPLCR